MHKLAAVCMIIRTGCGVESTIRGRSTSQLAMFVVLVTRVSLMAQLCGNLHQAGSKGQSGPGSSVDLRRFWRGSSNETRGTLRTSWW